MSKLLFSLCLLASLPLVSCSTVLNNLPGVYSLEIQQGNIVDQAMIDQLRPGMNKRQVLYIMGSPMLADTFHQKRWDYVYSEQPSGNKDRVQKRITLIFDNDQIIGMQGDLRPSAIPVVKASNEATVDVPKRDLDRTLWEKITGVLGYNGSDNVAKKEPPNPKPAGADDDTPH
ncbi:MAG: outer membrane protein assembly factor BamE [Methylovulum sp.]|nr:outer membrane protein assembly factor BamE [Methylovulum sp.]